MTDWHEIADTLAWRLMSHAFCENHPVAEARLDCPFCEDRAAYRRYLEAGGKVKPADFADAVAVDIRDLK